MQHGLGLRQGALADLNAQQQLALGIDRRPDPVRGPRETFEGLGFPDLAVSHRPDDEALLRAA